MRKLERVEQDLLRAGDIIAELERQSRSLKNQAGRARNYKVYSDRLKSIGRDFYLHSFVSLRAESQELSSRKEEAIELEETCRKHLAECQEKIREAEEEASYSAERVGSFRTQLAEVGARLQAAQERLGDLSDRRVELDERLERLQAQEQELGDVITSKTELGQTLEQDAESMSLSLGTLVESLDDARQREQDADRRIEQFDLEATQYAKERRDLNRQREGLRAQVVDVRSSDRHLLGARRKQVLRHNDMSGSIAEHQQEGITIRRLTESLSGQREGLELQQTSCQGRLDAIDEHIGNLGSHIDALKSERLSKASRHDALGGWIESLEGVDEGVKVLISASREGIEGCPKIKGLVANYIGASMTYAKALEAALGPLAQAVVVDHVEDAIQALEFLKEREVGRVTLVPLSRYLDLRRPAATADNRLLDHVRFSPELWPLFETLLGDVTVVENTAALSHSTGRTRLVTLEGDLRDRDGALMGGGSAGAAGLIRRRSELEALEGEIASLDDEIFQLEKRAEEASSERTAIVTERESIESKLQAVRDDEDGAQRRYRSNRDRLSVLQTDLRLGLEELHSMDRERSAGLKRLHMLEGSLAETEERDRELAKRLEANEKEGTQARDERNACIDKRRELDLERTRFDERLRALKEQRLANESALRSSQQDLARLKEQSEDAERRRGDVEGEESETEALQAELTESQTSLTTTLDEAAILADQWRRTLSEIREDEATRRENLEQSSESVRSILMKEERHQIQVERLRERVAEDFEFDLEEEVLGYEDDPEREDWDEIETELKELKAKIARLGPVNIDAIEELESVEERLNFMTSERDDLNHARRSLMSMISEMDAQSRTLFADTFHEVRENFRDIFRRLFTGGQADIHLNETDDAADAGVDIVAAPPGKRAQNITLLSGGERTLTAVALLFALFKAKPSPICVLDEVDAALDEANIERFCRILDDFESESQFLIVTHAKRTMARAEVLYGITMEGNGVSKPIAVRLGDYAEQN